MDTGTRGRRGRGTTLRWFTTGTSTGCAKPTPKATRFLHASKNFKLDLDPIAAVWNHGSVVRSWLNELAEAAFAKDVNLEDLRGYVEDSGEGRWTVQEAIDLDTGAGDHALPSNEASLTPAGFVLRE